MPTAIITIGPPASGKTSFLNEVIPPDSGFERICPDEIRQELCGDMQDQSKNEEVWELAYRRIAEALQAGRNIILDATNAVKEDRLKAIDQCRKSGADHISGLWFRTSLNICLRRNHMRERQVPERLISAMYESLIKDPPSQQEGFDRFSIVESETAREF